MSKGKYKAIKSVPKKKRKRSLERIEPKPFSNKEKSRTMIMPTDVLIAFFASLPTYDRTEGNIKNAGAFGKELIIFADTIPSTPEGEDQRKFTLAVVWIVANIMNVASLLVEPYIIYLNTEFSKLAKSIHSDHFKETVLSDSYLYMRFMTPFLNKAGVLDVDESLKKAEKINERI